MSTLEHAPGLERIEEAAEKLRAELERVLERARDEHRRLQDIDAELEDNAGALGSAMVVRHATAHRLRIIARALTRSQCVLVLPDDQAWIDGTEGGEPVSRYAAARQVLGWLGEAEADDAPWRTAAA